MSKTNKDSYISLIDDFKTIKNKLAKVATDSGQGKHLPKSGGVQTLLTLVELFMGSEERKKYENEYLGPGLKYQPLKEKLAKQIFQYLKPIQEKRRYYSCQSTLINKILKEGQEYASQIAQKTMQEVRKKMGLKEQV
jgi:tryptophanyl-tRNA synthetase